ncbi:hypothetical protein WCN91_08110 [Pseudoalteromonas sp. YIC-827]|uniref:PilZ domain-containing protein n=1 Tax=Pseudoalteromonas qingdaonensis TaxID=3131913 RepID=A0ABU9MVT9_9GAMM
MTDFTEQELAFFKQVFADQSVNNPNLTGAVLSLRSELPGYAANLFDSLNLCMLAEIGRFELWFPLTLGLTTDGDLQPKLDAPEIFDAQGQHRSWRNDDPSDCFLEVSRTRIPLLSLSSTGTVIDGSRFKELPQYGKATLRLGMYTPIKIEFDQIRQQNHAIALYIKVNHNKSALRRYLFECHKKAFANVYQQLTSQG